MKHQSNISLRKLFSWGLNVVCGLCAMLLLLIVLQLLFVTSFKIPSDSMELALLYHVFMWKMTCHAIAEKPLIGYGKGSFAMAYGNG